MQFLAFPIDPGKLEALHWPSMARFRIVRRSSFVQAGVPIFEVEEKCWFWWEPRGICLTFAEAELRVSELITAVPIQREVVKEYES